MYPQMMYGTFLRTHYIATVNVHFALTIPHKKMFLRHTSCMYRRQALSRPPCTPVLAFIPVFFSFTLFSATPVLLHIFCFFSTAVLLLLFFAFPGLKSCFHSPCCLTCRVFGQLLDQCEQGLPHPLVHSPRPPRSRKMQFG